MACSEGCHQGLQLRRRGRLGSCGPPAPHRDLRESQARTVRSARGQDGADGGPDSASSPRNPSWSPYALSATTARNAIPASGRGPPGPRRSPAWCGTPVVLPLREGPGLGWSAGCECVQPADGGNDLGGPGPVRRVGGPATAAVQRRGQSGRPPTVPRWRWSVIVARFTPSSARKAFAVLSPYVRRSHVRTLRASAQLASNGR